MAQVFIAHSSKDEWLVKQVCVRLKHKGIQPYCLEYETPLPQNWMKVVEQEIMNSRAVVILWTKNVASTQPTRDLVNHESSTALAFRKPLYVFVEKGIKAPLTLQQVATYHTFNPLAPNTLQDIMQRLDKIGFQLRKEEEIGKFVLSVFLFVLGLWVVFKNNGD